MLKSLTNIRQLVKSRVHAIKDINPLPTLRARAIKPESLTALFKAAREAPSSTFYLNTLGAVEEYGQKSTYAQTDSLAMQGELKRAASSLKGRLFAAFDPASKAISISFQPENNAQAVALSDAKRGLQKTPESLSIIQTIAQPA